MSENELIERVKKNVESPTISTDTGLEAAQEIGQIAETGKYRMGVGRRHCDVSLRKPAPDKRC